MFIHIGSYGVTDFYMGEGKIKVVHGGNMGAKKKDVIENTTKFFKGLDMFTLYPVVSEEGSPDYLYTAIIELGYI